MRINVGVLLLSCLPFGALAASAVDIVSPAPGACVNNGGVLFGGGVFSDVAWIEPQGDNVSDAGFREGVNIVGR